MRNILLFFRQNAYRKEIILIITIKLFALWLLWLICFSHPVPKNDIKEIIAKQIFASHVNSS